MREKLSVYVITYNEEKKIEDCLKSVTWADEIIVVDSFSTDRTIEITKKYTDKIYLEKFDGFGKLRNTAVSNTTYQWVLSVDADERVTAELRDEILKVLTEGPAYDAYFIPRKNYFLSYPVNYCGWYPDYRQPQLFLKSKMRYLEEPVHEGYKLNGKAGYLKQHIIQYPFLSIDEYFRKMDRYSYLAAQKLLQRGKKFRFYQVILHPIFSFLRMYILKKGFLDGVVGLILSLLYSYYTLAKYIKFWVIYNETKK